MAKQKSFEKELAKRADSTIQQDDNLEFSDSEEEEKAQQMRVNHLGMILEAAN